MFQNNKTTFGQPAATNTFGGFSGTSTNTAFGQSAFGKPATTGFSTPAFGAASTSLFGNTAPATGGLFGAPAATPVFGQTQNTQPSGFGIYPSNQASTNIFGTQQNANTGLFGGTSSTTSAFGASKPSFGGLGTSQASTGLFGQQTQQPQASTSLFGQSSTQTSSGLFGASGFGTGNSAQATGTVIKFAPLTGSDTMMKNNQTTTISTRHHCITCMKEYENKSLEELRLEDYAANRKGPQQGFQSTGLFGSLPPLGGTLNEPSRGVFGEYKPMFGGSTGTTGGFGATSTGVFGQPAQTGGGIFGKPTGFGTTPATTAATGFPSSFAQPTTNPFGQTATTKPFGAVQPQVNMFGIGTSQPSTGFGTQNTAFSGFGTQQNQSMGLFGQNKTTFNQMPTASTGSSYIFGQPAAATNTSSLFGAKPATGTGFGTGFGTNPAPAFGTSNNLFGQSFNKPATPGFMFPSTSTTGLGTGLNLGGQGLFGSTAAKPAGGLFGSNTGSMFNSGGFGTGSTFSTGQGFGSNLGLGGNQQMAGGLGGLGQSTAPTATPSHQQILALAAMPFGDSPLFRNLLPASGRTEELLKPTNPAAQKAVLSSNQFRVSPRNNIRLKVKPAVSAVLSKKSLFDGMEEPEKPSEEVFVPRISSRRLLLKPAKPVQPDCSPSTAARPAAVAEGSTAVDGVASPNTSAAVDKDDSWLHVVNTRPAKNLEGGKRTVSALQQSMTFLENNSNNSRTAVSPQPQAAVASTSSANKENVSLTSNSFEDSVVEEAEPSLLEDQQSHPTGIVLRRVGYYTIPPLDEITSIMGEDGTCVVENFTVGRTGYGNVFFPESFDVAGMNLDEIVHFRHKEVLLYPDDEKKPPVGEGLNRRAQVTLDRVWPIDKTTRQPITDADRLAQMDYESKLQRTCAKMESRFLEYRPQTGSWVFKVDHFSKYGMDESDDEDLPAMDVKKLKLGAPLQPGAHSTPQVPLPKTVQPFVPAVASATYIVEDEEMEAVSREPAMLRLRDHHTNLELDDDDSRDGSFHQSPGMQLAREIVTSSHKVQLMKASFFADEDVQDQDIETVDQFNDMPNYQTYKMLRHDDYPDSEASSKTDSDTIANSRLHKSFPTFRAQLGASPFVPRGRVVGVSEDDHRHWNREACVEVTPLTCEPKVVVLNHAADEHPSVSATAIWEHVQARNIGRLSDAVFINGLSFKSKWGPGSTLLNLVTKKSSATMALHGSWTELGEFLSGRSKHERSTDYVQRIRLTGGQGSQSINDSLCAHLSVQLDHSVAGAEGDCPALGPRAGVAAMQAHAALAAQLARDADPRDQLPGFAATAWALCVALWGEMPDLLDAGDAPHLTTMVRRRAVSDWLEAAVLPEARREIAEPRESGADHIAEILSLLSANQAMEACRLAQDHGDHNLALLLMQLRSGLRVRHLAMRQLTMWQEAEADQFISPERFKVYMLVAGLPLLVTSHGTINVCEGLDWKRAFALHLWYLCSPVTSVSDALLLYEDAFGLNDPANVYAAAPEPPFPRGTGKPSYDLCYQLLRLYSRKTHPLDGLLNPITHCEDPFDYRLSWFLLQTLTALGYSHSSLLSTATIHTNFASQLESKGLWKWAIFVLLHLRDARSRRSVVLDVIGRHISLSRDQEYLDDETFLVDQLNVPAEWIFRAKATLAASLGRHELAARYLIEAGSWNECHQTIMEHIAPGAIINESYNSLSRLLEPLEPEERSSTITGWTNGGQILWDFLTIMAEIKALLADRDLADGYKLEKLNPQLTSLCSRINMFPSHTPKHVVCQSHIAKVTASLVQTYLSLQPGGSRMATQTLALLVTQLPLPNESTQEVLATVVQSYLGERLAY